MDGKFSDWEGIAFVHNDVVGDVAEGSIDFGGIKITNDLKYIYLYIELNQDVNLQSSLNTDLYIDTDFDESTGLSIGGIGAELKWNFAAKTGMFYTDSDSVSVTQSNVDLFTFPTVSSDTFEIAFGLDVKPDNVNELFPTSQIRFILADIDSGDVAPDFEGGIGYQMEQVIDEMTAPLGIQKTDSTHLRFLTWNVRRDDLFNPDLYGEYNRVLNAIKPDIISFQEIYDHNSDEIHDLMETILPSNAGESWFTQIDQNDIALASRYEITGSWLPNSGNRAFLVNLSPTYVKDILIIGAHPPCCANDAERQNEMDGIMAFLRDARLRNGEVQLEENTPVILAGDLNLVGDKRQLETLLTGNILDNSTWGTDFNPDWDNSALADAIPVHTNLTHTFTWQNENSPFSPGRLDYIIYTDSVLKMEKTFVLRTEEMKSDTLSLYGLMLDDTRFASDHLPVVADFSLELASVTEVIDSPLNRPGSFILNQNYPNPFNPFTTMEFELQQSGFTNLAVYNIQGQKVATLIQGYINKGIHSVTWNAAGSASGVYFSILTSGEQTEIRKMLLLK
ncbi:MAG: endonuclease/exonuclease/phosphatase family protein [Candidatus Marinimicrobia bacterium]|nr:endonuclease/exonuclease/phosphatase family protein [Candidatus Neomarinimicrobiota bacterium]